MVKTIYILRVFYSNYLKCCTYINFKVLDRDAQMDKPCAWLDDVSWDNITELDK